MNDFAVFLQKEKILCAIVMFRNVLGSGDIFTRSSKLNTEIIFDLTMLQRPSRYFLRELARRVQQLEQKGVTVVVIQASKIDENALNKWVKNDNIPFAVGMVRGDGEKTKFDWGVRALPWLILADRNRVISAEGFGLSELYEKIEVVAEK